MSVSLVPRGLKWRLVEVVDSNSLFAISMLHELAYLIGGYRSNADKGLFEISTVLEIKVGLIPLMGRRHTKEIIKE